MLHAPVFLFSLYTLYINVWFFSERRKINANGKIRQLDIKPESKRRTLNDVWIVKRVKECLEKGEREIEIERKR